jgi:hypothetical protein
LELNFELGQTDKDFRKSRKNKNLGVSQMHHHHGFMTRLDVLSMSGQQHQFFYRGHMSNEIQKNWGAYTLRCKLQRKLVVISFVITDMAAESCKTLPHVQCPSFHVLNGGITEPKKV